MKRRRRIEKKWWRNEDNRVKRGKDKPKQDVKCIKNQMELKSTKLKIFVIIFK